MTDFERLASQLEQAWGGQTLATLRDEALRQFNGTATNALRQKGEPRRFLLCCVTGEYELRKLGFLDPAGAHSFGDWSKVSLFEAVVFTIAGGGFCYDFERSSSDRLSSVTFIAVAPDSVTKLEQMLGLGP